MSGRRGFTLLEVLVSVAILATVSATVAVVMGVGTESWRAAASFAETGHDGEAVLEQVVLALRSACYPSDGELSYDYGFRHEDGGEGAKASDLVEWTKIGNALVGEDVPWAGSPHRTRLYVDEDGPDGPGLYAAAWQIVGLSEDFDADEDPVPVLLSDMVTGLDVRMLDPEKEVKSDEPFEWTDEWTYSNRIPQRVFVSLALKPNGPKGEPQELVRTTDIPLSELSWSPVSAGRGGERSGDGPERDGEGRERPGEGRNPGGAEAGRIPVRPGSGTAPARGSGADRGPGTERPAPARGSGGGMRIEGISGGGRKSSPEP